MILTFVIGGVLIYGGLFAILDVGARSEDRRDPETSSG